MNEEQKRVNDYYENLYGKGPLKPEGELRERIRELEAQVAERNEMVERLKYIYGEGHAKLREAAQMIVDAHDKAGPTTEHGLHCACMNLLAVLEADK